jgi:hypothetical protein
MNTKERRKRLTSRVRTQWFTTSHNEATRSPPFATVVEFSKEKLFIRSLLAGPCSEVHMCIQTA